MAQWAMIFGGGHGRDREGGNIFGLLVMMIVALLAAMIIQMAVSRSREYGANVEGARLTGDPLALATRFANSRWPLSEFRFMSTNPKLRQRPTCLS